MSRNIDGRGPIGQEFRPETNKLNLVQLYLDDASCSTSGGPGASVQVRIRRAEIDGAVLGASRVVSFPNCFGGVVSFVFDRDVRLARDGRYVIEVVPIAGQAAAWGNDGGSTYARGRQIIRGVLVETSDLWFREGTVHPTPKDDSE